MGEENQNVFHPFVSDVADDFTHGRLLNQLTTLVADK